MTISIGTSGSPSARDTHAAWLRRRDDSGRQLADLFAGAPVPVPAPATGPEPVRQRP